MKSWILIFSLLIFVSGFVNGQSDLQTKTSSSFNLQLGGSTGFGTTPFIPNLGFGMKFGSFGFRATGQFFQSTPDFDAKAYLQPVASEITLTNYQEKGSNTMFGLTPFFGFGGKKINFEAGLGIKYLMQKGATATAVYTAIPTITILQYPVGDTNFKSLVLEPSFRALFGPAGKSIRFYAEASYVLPVGKTDFTYTTRGNLTSVLSTKGSIDAKALIATKEVTNTGKFMTGFVTLGVGIELNLSHSKPAGDSRTVNSVNNYGVNDDGIKKTVPTQPVKTTDETKEPVSYDMYEIKPLVLISKGITRPTSKDESVEFNWIALNANECGPLQFEFTLDDVKYSKGKIPETDILAVADAKQPDYKVILNDKNLSNKGNGLYSYKLSKKEMPDLYVDGKHFIWKTRAMDASGNTPPCASGGSNFVMDNYVVGNCTLSLAVDSIHCATQSNRMNTYEVCFRIQNNSIPGTCTNNPVSININNLFIRDINSPNAPHFSWIDQSMNPFGQELLIPIGQWSNLLCVKVNIPTGTSQAYLSINPEIGFPDYAEAAIPINFPACGCNFCGSVRTSINSGTLNTVDQNGYGTVNFPVTITYAPFPVNRVVAEIVAFEHIFNNEICTTCNMDNRMHGVFVGTTENHLNGITTGWMSSGKAYLQSSTQGYSRQAVWSTLSQNGINLSGQGISLNLGVPLAPSFSGCQDQMKWTIRFSFFSKDPETGKCRVCETTKSFCMVRKGQKLPQNLGCKTSY